MTVVEALPGGGWYSKILLPCLGEGGKLVGAQRCRYHDRVAAHRDWQITEN